MKENWVVGGDEAGRVSFQGCFPLGYEREVPECTHLGGKKTIRNEADFERRKEVH